MTKTVIAILLMLPQVGAAQQAVFDAVSIRPADPGLRKGIDLRILPGGRFVSTMCTLGQLIDAAYGIQRYQRTGGPGWTDDVRFDVTATSTPAEGEENDEVMMAGRPTPRAAVERLQTMLTNRFALKTHWETRQGTVFYLTVAKSGPKFTDAPPDEERPLVTLNRPGSRELPATTFIIKGHRASMHLLAIELEQHFNSPVIDNTGLSGNYNFAFEYSADEARLELGPSLVTAIQEQAGLKLEAGNGPVKVLVVDDAQHPSQN